MLVISRKSQESVIVGGSDGFEGLLRVTVLEISGGKVKLGFEVDKDVPVHRWEVWERIHAKDQPASLPLDLERAQSEYRWRDDGERSQRDRRALNPEGAQSEDRWQDDGGQW